MPRKSLRPNLNQIRAWARQGRTDAWVAHQLEVSVRDIEQFKRQNDLAGDDNGAGAATEFEEIDLRAEDDALIAAELEAAEAEAERALAEAAEKGEHGDEEESEGGGSPPPPQPPWRATPLEHPQRAARGHLRPWRGGLRALARPGNPGQPGLRRAL